MSKTRQVIVLAGLCLMAAPALADEFGVKDFHKATHSGLRLDFGSEVTVTEPAANGVVAGGGHVTIDGIHTGDIFAGGDDVALRNVDAERVVVGGGKVMISGNIHNGIIGGGGDVTVAHGTIVTNDAILAGGHVIIDATISGDVMAAGQTVELAGKVDGDVQVKAGTIVIQPGTEIGGDLTYASREAFSLPANVSVKGQVMREAWKDTPTLYFGGWHNLIALAGIAAGIVGLACLVLIAAAMWFVWYLLSGPRADREPST